MNEEILIASISENPFNPRIQYDATETKALAASLKRNGQLSPVKVREKSDGKYELVFGHRRIRAAKLLGWRSIKAEIESANDEEMLIQSLVENMDRENLSDYERAQSFLRLLKEFNWSQEEIGSAVGYSRSHVCNFLRMAEIFSSSDLASDPELLDDLGRISEHHARYLARIIDTQARKNMLKLVVRENASVRDLQRMFQKLSGWFDMQSQKASQNFAVLSYEQELSSPHSKQNVEDRRQIVQILDSEFNSPKSGRDFQDFLGSHALGLGFSLFSSDAPFDHPLIENEAIERERSWYHSTESLALSNLRNVRIQFLSKVALATLLVDCTHSSSHTETIRGTVVFVKRYGKWKILHEHWSERPKARAMRPTIRLLAQEGIEKEPENGHPLERRRLK